ncbi:MAG: prepilin-type N-terminal cleavage/methylation domain-containing protein [Luteolibacter sp.]|jgi:prepilin-type N-terminal cleavage/methylation domain-containing protein|nr:prepilin-type N-terminal cleavage/methylation domain-containing protein [Luteolibacter sp.]
MTRTTGNPRGFTLIELLSAMTIGTIILLAAASLLGSSGDGYERVGGSMAAEREARAIITQLRADLATARFHKDGIIQSSSKSWPDDRLAFLGLQPAQAQSEDGLLGDLCAVNYYIKDLPIGGKTVRCLMRGFRESADTFAALQNGKLSLLFSPQGNIDEPVAFGVVSFQARPKSRDAAGGWIDWVKNDSTGPEAFDVRLVIARRDLAGRLRQAADWDGGGTAGSQLGQPSEARRNPNLEVYETRIRFGDHDTP